MTHNFIYQLRLSGDTRQLQQNTVDWFTQNGLGLNPDKTEILVIGARPLVKALKTNSMIKVANCEIEPSGGIKNHEITIDSTLSFDKLIGLIC